MQLILWLLTMGSYGQPFLTPVPPNGSDVLATMLLPFGYVIGVIRTLVIILLALLYALLVHGLCLLLVGFVPCALFVPYF